MFNMIQTVHVKQDLLFLDQLEPLDISFRPSGVLDQGPEKTRAVGLLRVVVNDNAPPTRAVLCSLHKTAGCATTILVDPPILLKSTNQIIRRLRLQLIPDVARDGHGTSTFFRMAPTGAVNPEKRGRPLTTTQSGPTGSGSPWRSKESIYHSRALHVRSTASCCVAPSMCRPLNAGQYAWNPSPSGSTTTDTLILIYPIPSLSLERNIASVPTAPRRPAEQP